MIPVLLVGGSAEPGLAQSPVTSRSSPSAEDFRTDYREACRLVATRYFLLEEKTGLSRVEFQKRLEREADSIPDANPRAGFLRAMATLRSSLADGHMDWSLGRELQDPDSHHLGVVLTAAGNRLRVGWAAPGLAAGLCAGDEITTWNGQPAEKALAAMMKRVPQSTTAASREFAARMLAFEPSWQPLQGPLKPVAVAFVDAKGTQRRALLEWQSGRPLLNRNGLPSLEDLPVDAEAVHESLRVYFCQIQGKTVAVLHPRAFSGWSAADLDRALAKIDARRPEALVIDLHDSAGGSFEQVSILLQALGISQPFRWILQDIDPSTGKTQSRPQDYLADDHPRRLWSGTLLVRTNPICGSGCDYFAYMIQSRGRGRILGQPSAGRGLGTDDFALKATGTVVTIPLRQRILLPERHRIEGQGVNPDVPIVGDMKACLTAYFLQHS